MNAGALDSTRSVAGRAARWASVALGCSIPVSVALDNVLLAVVAVCWIVAGAWRETWQGVRANAVSLAALGLFALLVLGSFYGERSPGDATAYLSKYIDLLFIPVFAFLFREAALRRHGIHALAASLAGVLAISYLIALGMPAAKPLLGSQANPVVLKHYLTHGVLIAFGAFLFAELALAQAARGRRLLWAAAALAAAVNVLFMVDGRTGQVVLAVLALLLGYHWRRWQGIALAAGAVAITVTALALSAGSFQALWGLARDTPAPSALDARVQVSNRDRLEFYRVSLQIIQEHPVTGVGTGGFPRAYADKVRGSGAYETRNPHNEYLLFAVQLGAIGFAALLCLFWMHWRLAPGVASPLEQRLARGLLLTIAVGCLFNSFLLDHTEGLLYAWLTGLLFGGLKADRVSAT